MRVAPDNDDITDDTLPKPGPVCDDRTGTTVGNYTLQERLGSGGMASVYRAVHRNFDELVAVKLLSGRYGAQPEMRRRFLREAVVMREISARNNHVVRALDFGETQAGEAYLVMDYLTGQDLQQLLRTVGPLPWSRVAPLALQLCDALATTHAHGIIHRDIKPSNCLLTEEAGQQRLKLIDFGVAKDLGAADHQTDVNVVLGTPAYLAPEQLSGAAEPDVRSDIYAVGATLYCLLTGRPPHVGSHTVVAHKQRTEPPPPPSAERPPELPRVPRAADALVLRALDLDPDHRFQSAADLADEIRRSLATPPAVRPLAGPQLGLRAAWFAALAASAAVVMTIGAATPRPPPPTYSGSGVPLALADPATAAPFTANPPGRPQPATTKSNSPGLIAAAVDPPAPATPPVPEDTPAAVPPVPQDTPAPPQPVPADTPAAALPVPEDIPAAAPPASAPATTASDPPAPPQPVPSATTASDTSAPSTSEPRPVEPPPAQPVPKTSPPTAPPAPPSATSATSATSGSTGSTTPAPTPDPPVDPRTQRVRRILDKQREALRRECRDLSGGAKRLRFTLTLAKGAIEAVAAQPGTFRECVRSTLRSLDFGPAADGQFEYSFAAR